MSRKRHTRADATTQATLPVIFTGDIMHTSADDIPGTPDAVQASMNLALVLPPEPAPIPVGTRVCCTYRGEHRGTVVAEDDPRAWACTLQFPSPTPDPDAVRAHVAMIHACGVTLRGTPVLWDFGRVYWDVNVFPAEGA